MAVFIRTSLQIASLLALSAFTPVLSAAVEIECEYFAHSEWPSVEGRVCQSATTAPLLLSDDQTTLSQWPTCADSSSDHDGDGWGWENFRSCRVDTATLQPDTSDSATDPITTGPSSTDSSSNVPGFATCSSSASDPDGDGWGWENHDSCIVGPDTVQSAATEVPETIDIPETAAATAYNPRFKICLSAASDPDGDGWGWENHDSCIVAPEITQSTGTTTDSIATVVETINNNTSGDTGNTDSTIDTIGSDPDALLQKAGNADVSPNNAIIFQQDFESAATGTYNPELLNTQWDTPIWHLGFNEGRANIVTDPQKGQSLQITFPAGKFGAGGASAFLSDLAFGIGIEGHFEELYLTYDMKFAEGFDFVQGGKLPGLCGYSYKQTPAEGCNTGGGFPSGFDGWSARGMWREDGTLENYVYNASQRSFYGDDEYWNVKAIPGQWHRVQHRVVLNTVGQKNGILEAWFDGSKVLSDNTFEYRKTEDIKVNLFYFNTFFGGNDSTWAPSTDQFITFDNFRISTQALENSNDFSSTLLQNDSNQKAGSSSGGGALSAPALWLLLLLRRWRQRYHTLQ